MNNNYCTCDKCNKEILVKKSYIINLMGHYNDNGACRKYSINKKTLCEECYVRYNSVNNQFFYEDVKEEINNEKLIKLYALKNELNVRLGDFRRK